ncbi:MAG: 2-C-methyl-D-erythritol 2,4-cyclodiphosphate synthase [Pirellulaceae bacterium]|nr:MAG: 2-C-methyl-D-erythritol 2,4-cyclodiphosphate synthase [Pirellulaceae bacterium]
MTEIVTGDSHAESLPWRVGWGHDTHRLEPGGPLRIGGITIPWDHHLVGHSDADVLLHAVVDALLGALAWGDIGEWFPDDSPAHRGQDSSHMVRQVVERLMQEGWRVANADCTVFAEKPRLTPHKSAIRRRIAELLQVGIEQVSVKAKTGERLDAVGRGEAIAAACVALVTRAGPAPAPSSPPRDSPLQG